MEENKPKLYLYPVFLFIGLLGLDKKFLDGFPIVTHDTITQKLQSLYRDYKLTLRQLDRSFQLAIERVSKPLDKVIVVTTRWTGKKSTENGQIKNWHVVDMNIMNMYSRPREYVFLLRIVAQSETLRSLDFEDDYPALFFEDDVDRFEQIESLSDKLFTKLYDTKGWKAGDAYKQAEKYALPFIKTLLLDPAATQFKIPDHMGPGDGIYSMPSSLTEGMEGGEQFAKE